MIPLIQEKQTLIADLCLKYQVKRLELFGSATQIERFDLQQSDIDFLVEFNPPHSIDRAEQYFGLLEEMQRLFPNRIDLVSAKALKNPYFIAAIQKQKELIYAS